MVPFDVKEIHFGGSDDGSVLVKFVLRIHGEAKTASTAQVHFVRKMPKYRRDGQASSRIY